MNLKDLQYLKHLNSLRSIVIIFIIALTVYLIVKSPKIKYTTEIQLEKAADTLLVKDTLKQDTTWLLK